MSKTYRRGKPSRNFHKYIGLGIIHHENRRWFNQWALSQYQGHLYWKDGHDDPTTYDQYTSLKIRHYHMDYRPWFKSPGWVNRMDIEYNRRQAKRSIYEAIRDQDFDVIVPKMGKVGQRIWDWY